MGIRKNEGLAEGLKGFYGPKKAYIKKGKRIRDAALYTIIHPFTFAA